MALHRIVAPLTLLLLLAGCASMPLSSMVQLAAMGREGLERVDPAQVRVRLSVSQGYEIDVSRARLRLSVTAPRGASRDVDLSLELIERSRLVSAAVDAAERRGVGGTASVAGHA